MKWLVGLLVGLSLIMAGCCEARQVIDLSGEWEFRADTKDVGKDEKWFDEGVVFDKKITVPGAWNAQGVGEPSESLFNAFSGPGWYRKHVRVPEDWRGKEMYICFAGIFRSVDVWVNGEFQGTHQSFLTAFRFEIAHLIVKNWTIDVVVRVDGRRDSTVNPLVGSMDLIDLPNASWGGIYGGVWLENTQQSYIERAYVIPRFSNGVAEVIVETGSRIMYGGSAEPQPDFHLQADIYDQLGKHVASNVSYKMLPAMVPDFIMVELGDPKLWSPKKPYVYTLDIRLYKEDEEIDYYTTTFGFREISVEGDRFMLNGKPIFLRGYTDSCIFPNSIAPPADKSVYVERFKIAKDYGFNFVRCHSWAPPKEYLDAADEIGMMVMAELPIAGPHYYKDNSPDIKQFYLEQWKGMIKERQSHPSIIAWSMSNGLVDGFAQAQEMYMTATEADKTRLIVDTSGILPPKRDQKPRVTLDFLPVRFDMKAGGESDFRIAKSTKPVIIHDIGDYGTIPNLDKRKLYSGGVRPFWLFSQQVIADYKGIASQFDKWVENSNKLQTAVLKADFEAARLSENIRGYSDVGLQDCWASSTGVLDAFFRPKALASADFRKFNAPTVLLMESARRNYWAGETAEVSWSVSRYEDAPTNKAKLTWKLLDADIIIDSGEKGDLKLDSVGLEHCHKVNLKMPTSGIARKLTLIAEISDENGKTDNCWDFWVYPRGYEPISEDVCVEKLPVLKEIYPKARFLDTVTESLDCRLLITSKMTPKVVQYLDNGGSVLLIGPTEALSTVASSYKPYSGIGDAQIDSNAGTIIDMKHPAVAAMPQQDWCDLNYYDLLNDSHAVLLDDLPERVEPIIRCLDMPSNLRSKAYLFEVRVGKGKLLVGSMNFRNAIEKNDPAGSYLLDRLVKYTLGPKFEPSVALRGSYLLKLIDGS